MHDASVKGSLARHHLYTMVDMYDLFQDPQNNPPYLGESTWLWLYGRIQVSSPQW